MNAGQDKVAANAEQDPATKGDKTKERLLTAEEEKQNVEAKRKRLHDMTEYEDLEQVPAKKPATLNISRSDRYVMMNRFTYSMENQRKVLLSCHAKFLSSNQFTVKFFVVKTLI